MAHRLTVPDFFLKTRRLFLFREIDQRLSLRIVKLFKFLANTSDLPIFLYINSYGGSLDSAKCIIDEILSIRESGCEVWTIAQGIAGSAAADILCLGSPSYRFASFHSSIMLHPMSFDLPPDYQSVQEQTMKFYAKDTEILDRLIAKACGKGTPRKLEQFRKDIDKSLWLTAEEAIKYGVIDRIWDYNVEGEMNAILQQKSDNK